MKRNCKRKSNFLPEEVFQAFCCVINSSDIFRKDEDFKHKFNLICTFIDRIASSLRFLNSHASVPKSQEDFINFLVHCAIIRDGILKFYENILHRPPSFILEKKYFFNAMNRGMPYFTKETCPTDDNFFEYLRGVAFAHPFEMSYRGKKRLFMQKEEEHYCPFVFIDNPSYVYDGFDDAVGVRIYSSKNEEGMIDLIISFSSLKDYIKSRYECINELTKWAKDGIDAKNEEWSRVKVNRNQGAIETLQEVKDILESRYIDAYNVETALCCLKSELTCKENEENVEIFREAICKVIPAACDCVDSFDYEGLCNTLSILDTRPRNSHDMLNYQLEKIYCNLDVKSDVVYSASNEYWGLKQTKDFSQEFAKKWVKIDADNMPYDEIKLLARTACYLEAKEQMV